MIFTVFMVRFLIPFLFFLISLAKEFSIAIFSIPLFLSQLFFFLDPYIFLFSSPCSYFDCSLCSFSRSPGGRHKLFWRRQWRPSKFPGASMIFISNQAVQLWVEVTRDRSCPFLSLDPGSSWPTSTEAELPLRGAGQKNSDNWDDLSLYLGSCDATELNCRNSWGSSMSSSRWRCWNNTDVKLSAILCAKPLFAVVVLGPPRRLKETGLFSLGAVLRSHLRIQGKSHDVVCLCEVLIGAD